MSALGTKPHPALLKAAIRIQRHLMGGPLVDPDLEEVSNIINYKLRYTKLVDALQEVVDLAPAHALPTHDQRYQAARAKAYALLAAIDGDHDGR